jgi:hypothetical protein
MKFASIFIILFLFGSLVQLSGCSGGGTTGSEDLGSGGGSGSTDDLTTIKSTSPLYITVTTQYDGDLGEATPVRYHGVCSIDPDNLAANDITCDITIPEGWLFYSKMTLEYGTGNNVECPRIEFYPYYRKQSNSAAYVPRGATADVDCTDPTTVACYDGAALDIVPNFPKNTGLWFPTENVTNFTSVVNSAWSQESKTGNTHTCNNLAVGSRGADVTVGGVQIYESSAGWQDYVIACYDPHQGTLYRITMTIADEDTDASDTDAGNDEFYDWN